ncbi:MAG: hypothetical protein GY835_28165 [bacterium]|nr:hypothetical protein [bacterium]
MNYRFYDVASNDHILKPVSMQKLASHIATDWIPGVPKEAEPGFVNILSELLKSDTGSPPSWCIRRKVANFDRQWKIVTSWIVGIAFCREVMEDFGYQFWAPVSAFSSATRETAASGWTETLSRLSCDVKRPDPPTSRLLPDYVAAREQPGSHDVTIAFFESKGTRDAIGGHILLKPSWRRQAQNAEFSYNDTFFEPERRVVVGTRLFPSAKRPKNRCLVVRAWNSSTDTVALSTPAACSLVVQHYYTLCQAFGMEETAHALSLAARSTESQEAREALAVEYVDVAKRLGRERERSSKEFVIGDRRMIVRIGKFGEEALALLTAADSGREKDIRHLLSRVAERQRSAKRVTHEQFERPDGVEVILE